MRKKLLLTTGAGLAALIIQAGPDSSPVRAQAAAALTGLGEREIFRLIETGELHFIEAERVFVCRDSSMNRSKLSAAGYKEEN